ALPPVAGGDLAWPGAEGWRVLMDEMQVRLTDMSLVVGYTNDSTAGAPGGGGGVSAYNTSYNSTGTGGGGQNIIRDVGSGVIVSLHRPLMIQPDRDAADSAVAADLAT
ncbi:hypothetical protein VaNZ11_000963, partial [Volvox africanus]